jgi:hypothetical protein
MTLENLAKARDGLLAKGISISELTTTSQILRLTFYYGIIYLCEDPKSPPSQESTEFVKKKLSQTRLTKGLTLNDLE